MLPRRSLITGLWLLCAPAAGVLAAPQEGDPPRVRMDEKAVMARLLSGTPAVQPPLAKKARAEGVVRVRCVIGTDGAVQEIDVEDGHPLLVESALTAIRSWRFDPVLAEGRPVEILTVFRVRQFRRRDIFNAFLTRFQDVARKRPQDARARLQFAERLHLYGSLDDALSEYRAAAQLRPEMAAAHFGMAGILLEKGDLAGAAAAFRAGLRSDPANAAAHHSLSVALAEQGDAQSALAEAREAVRLKPKVAVHHLQLGVVLAQLGQSGEAVAALREAARLDKDNAGAHFQLGLALEKSGHTSAALEAFRQAARLAPGRATYQRHVSRLTAASLQSAGPPARVRVPPLIQEKMLTYRADPEDPYRDPGFRTEGVVRLQVLIAEDGTVKDIRVLDGHPLLAAPAERAVRQWRYRPTLLNNRPVEVVTTAEVVFSLGARPDSPAH
jgi:TonB family protein